MKYIFSFPCCKYLTKKTHICEAFHCHHHKRNHHQNFEMLIEKCWNAHKGGSGEGYYIKGERVPGLIFHNTLLKGYILSYTSETFRPACTFTWKLSCLATACAPRQQQNPHLHHVFRQWQWRNPCNLAYFANTTSETHYCRACCPATWWVTVLPTPLTKCHVVSATLCFAYNNDGNLWKNRPPW